MAQPGKDSFGVFTGTFFVDDARTGRDNFGRLLIPAAQDFVDQYGIGSAIGAYFLIALFTIAVGTADAADQVPLRLEERTILHIGQTAILRTSSLHPYTVRSTGNALASLASAREKGAVITLFFGGTAMLVAALGIYGVLTHVVSRRTREIGVRMALGAHPKEVTLKVVGQSMRPVLAGLFAGVAIALAAVSVDPARGARHKREALSDSVRPLLPIRFKTAVENTAPQSKNRVGSAHGPKHARLFEA